MDIVISKNNFGIPLFKFSKNKRNVGSISMQFTNCKNPKEGFNILTWKSEKGYGRKIMKSLFELLKETNLINNNSMISGYISPIKCKSTKEFNMNKNRLKRIYTQMGFIINENNFFEQKYKNIHCNDDVIEPQTPKKNNTFF